MSKQPSNWWFLPPGLAGGFYVLVFGILSPAIPVIFFLVCLPLSGLAYFFGYSVAKDSFNKEKEVAKGWAWIVMAWMSVLGWYVTTELFYCELIGC
jgi:hypothetical protein